MGLDIFGGAANFAGKFSDQAYFEGLDYDGSALDFWF